MPPSPLPPEPWPHDTLVAAEDPTAPSATERLRRELGDAGLRALWQAAISLLRNVPLLLQMPIATPAPGTDGHPVPGQNTPISVGG